MALFFVRKYNDLHRHLYLYKILQNHEVIYFYKKYREKKGQNKPCINKKFIKINEGNYKNYKNYKNILQTLLSHFIFLKKKEMK